MFSHPGLARSLFFYFLVTVFLITLSPFDFQIPDRFLYNKSVANWTDFYLNIFMFMPIGFFFGLSKNNINFSLLIKTLFLGCILSSTIEIIQIFLPDRYTSLSDVIANSLGAGIGGLVFGMLRYFLSDRPVHKVITLHLPLTGVLYLLIPLSWLNSLAYKEIIYKIISAFLIGFFAVIILISLYINRLRFIGNYNHSTLAILFLIWFFIANIYLFSQSLEYMLFIAMSLSIIIVIGTPKKAHCSHERRFEIPTIKRCIGWYLVYILLLAFNITDMGFYRIFDTMAEDFPTFIAFHASLFEYFTAFILLGYMLAEMRSRYREPLYKLLLLCTGVCLLLLLPIDIVSVWQNIHRYPLFELLLAASALFFGVLLYRAQLMTISKL